MSHDQVRSTTHRRGRTSNRWSWILLTTSAEMWWAPQAAMKVLLNPPSHQIFFNRPDRSLARSTTAMPPTLSDTLAATTNTATILAPPPESEREYPPVCPRNWRSVRPPL